MIKLLWQWFVTGRWFSPGTPVSSTNKTDHHDIAEILLKMALNTITLYRIPLYSGFGLDKFDCICILQYMISGSFTTETPYFIVKLLINIWLIQLVIPNFEKIKQHYLPLFTFCSLNFEIKYFVYWCIQRYYWIKSFNWTRFYHSSYKGLLWSWSYSSCIYNFLCKSVSITTKVVSSNPIHGEVYSMQLHVIKFVNELQQVYSFLRLLQFPPPIKLIVTIWLKYWWILV